MCIHDCKNYTSKIHTYYDGSSITRFLKLLYKIFWQILILLIYILKKTNYTKISKLLTSQQ